MTWLLGIDAGLTNVKAALFDENGREVTVAARRPPNEEPAPGHVERDLDDLWIGVRDAVRDVLAEGPADGGEIASVGVAGHGHGLYVLDAKGEPVRNGIKSTDSRAVDLVDEWRRDGVSETVREITGYEPFAADPLSLLAWLKREEPDSYRRIAHILFCKDYLKYRLTGAICTDEMEASVFFDIERGDYADAVFDVLDIPECVDCLPDVVPSWEQCGTITEPAAAETGLAEGTPVASGLHDIGATALGAGVHEEGQAMLIVGTWGQSIAVLNEPRPDEAAGGITRRYLTDRWLRYKGNRSAATCVDWFVEECGTDWRAAADAEDIDPYEVYNRTVASVPPGADGLLFHPYLHGSTDNPSARAGFYGLTEDHTKAHMLRAIYEGVAVSQAERLAELEPHAGLSDVRLGGGGAKSEVWSQLFADVLDTEITVATGTEVGARGAAICAALAVDTFPDHEAAVDQMVGIERRHAPDEERVETYRTIRDVFERARTDMQATWEQLRAGIPSEQGVTHDE